MARTASRSAGEPEKRRSSVRTEIAVAPPAAYALAKAAGSGMSASAPLLGLDCVVYMGAVDTKRQALNVARMLSLIHI